MREGLSGMTPAGADWASGEVAGATEGEALSAAGAEALLGVTAKVRGSSGWGKDDDDDAGGCTCVSRAAQGSSGRNGDQGGGGGGKAHRSPLVCSPLAHPADILRRTGQAVTNPTGSLPW